MLFPAGQANAEIFNNLKFSGELDIQSISAHNITDFATRANDNGVTVGVANNQDRMGATQTRTMVRMDWDLLDDVHSRISLTKRNRYWGGAGAAQGESLDTVQTNITVDEANVKIDKLVGDVNATLGRQYYGTPGDMIAFYGPLMRMGFGMGVRSLDAARFDWAGEHMNATILMGKPDSSGTNGIATAGTTDIRAIILGCTKHENVTGNVYLWNKATHNAAAGVGEGPNYANAGAKNDNLYVAGIKAKAKMGALWFGGEFAKNFGTQRTVGTLNVLSPAANYTGMAFKADAGYKAEMEGTAAFEPWAQFALGTGRVNSDSNKNEAFQAINPNYLPGSIWGRFTTLGSNIGNSAGLTAADANPANDGSLSSIRNKVIWGVGVKTTPAALNKLTVGLSWWNFRLHRITTSSAVTTKVANGNKNIGSEADLDFTWKHSQNVTLGFGAATFQPGGLIKETQKAANATMPNNPATMAYMDLRINWGGWSAKN
jgi:hypothetical protein